MNLEKILGLDPRSLHDRTERFIEALYDEWKDEAPSQSYRESLILEVVSDTQAQVALDPPGVFAERGTPGGRDMREYLLASPKAHHSKIHGGRYLAIPMKDGMRTASDRGKPWMTKSKPGAGVIVRIRAKVPDLVRDFWSHRF